MGLFDLFSDTLRAPAECVITVDGTEIVDLYPFLLEVTVESTRTEAAEAVLRFESRRAEDGEWIVQDQEVLVPWKSVTIEAAFGNHTEPVFEGFIQQVEADYPENAGGATVVVTCRDASLRLDREHVRHSWGTEDQPIGDSQILAEIVSGRHNLAVAADSASGQDGLIQVNQDSTDITFLRRRAEANGYELLFEGESVYFGPMRVEAEPQATILVYAGNDTNCLSFSVSTDGHAPDQIAYEVAAPEGTEVTEEVVQPDLALMGTSGADSSSAGLGDFVWRLSREGSRSASEQAALAQSRANEAAMRVHARGELDGSLYGHVLRVGHPVGVDGVGAWLGGTYYVDTVTHRFDTQGYRQSFGLLRNAYGDNL
jgi:phage protein D